MLHTPTQKINAHTGQIFAQSNNCDTKISSLTPGTLDWTSLLIHIEQNGLFQKG